MTLDSKVALVTGGASGIGAATARALADAGCRLAIIDVSEEEGQSTAKSLEALYHRADVSQSADWEATIAAVGEALGPVDIAVLNAGMMSHESDLTAVTDDLYQRVIGVNIGGAVLGTRALLPSMVARQHGAIVVMSSIGGLAGFPQDPLYTATKHALVGFVRAMAPTLGTSGVTINAVCPGAVDTPLARRDLQRFGIDDPASVGAMNPADIAASVLEILRGGGTGGVFAALPGVLRDVPPADLGLSGIAAENVAPSG